jgi:NAD(P)-dependent dehydrogenase (short-subunit alcohol dehydrogenase family)
LVGLLEGRVALVSGVGPGLGRSLALACAREGADVVLSARSTDALAEVAHEIEKQGRRAMAVPADITAPGDAERVVDEVRAELGRLDVLVNNAFTTGPFAPVADLDPDEWRTAFEVNVIGSVAMTVAAVPLLAESDAASVVMIGSQAARRSQPRRGPYSASKAALLSAARTLAGELGAQGIRVNTVVPGHIWGASLAGFFAQTAERRGTTSEEVYESVARETALRRIPDAEEIADVAVLLASPLARAVTGQSLDVNAGNWFE